MQLQLVAEMQAASRQLSKRQITWFRGDPMYQWIEAARPLPDVADDIIASVLSHRHPGACLLTVGTKSIWFIIHASIQQYSLLPTQHYA